MKSELNVDDAQLYRDVKELLFKDCRDTTTWDHLGNLVPVRRPTEKKVHIVEKPTDIIEDHMEMLELPPGLAVLYEAAAVDPERRVGVLIYALNILSLPPPPHDHCHWLHEQAMQRLAKIKAEDEARRKAAEEAELKECRFKPLISEEAKKQPSKLKDFSKGCLEWQRMQHNKLKKKVDKEEREKWEEIMVPWEMSKRSKYLTQRAKSPSHVSYKRVIELQPRARSAERQRGEPLSFTPVTNRAATIELLFSGSPAKSGQEDVASPDVELPQEGLDKVTTLSQLQQRMDEDIKARRERAEKRKEEYLRRQTEKLYDKISGQPLFEPNAMPTVERRDGLRVAYDELTPKEQKRLRRNLQFHRIIFVPELSRKHQEQEHRRLDDVVQGIIDREKSVQMRHQRKMRRIREETAEECIFHPKISEKSKKIASSITPERHRQRKKTESDTSSKASLHKMSEEEIEQFLNRLEDNNEKTKQDREFIRRREEIHLARMCTFKPSLSPTSVDIVEGAERRLQSGIAAKDAWNMTVGAQQPLSAPRSASKAAPVPKSTAVTSGSYSRPRAAPTSIVHPAHISEVAFASPLPEVPTARTEQGYMRAAAGQGDDNAASSTSTAHLVTLINDWEELNVSVERSLRH